MFGRAATKGQPRAAARVTVEAVSSDSSRPGISDFADRLAERRAGSTATINVHGERPRVAVVLEPAIGIRPVTVAEPRPGQRVDVFLQYYRPHVSGLTNMAAVLAQDASAHGFDVHVHCVAQGGPSSVFVLDGVTVHTYRRSFSVGRGVFSLALVSAMWRLRKGAGIAHVHMPYPESFLLSAILGPGWKFVLTYQCDAPLSGGVDSLIARALDWSHRRLIKRSSATVLSSGDYADHSRLRASFDQNHRSVIPVTGEDRAGGSPVYAVPGRRLVGFMGRPTFEKGIDVLLDAFADFPLADVSLLFAGPVTGLSEKVGYDTHKLNALIESGRILTLGFLEDEQIKDFFASLDAYVLPSINSFEAFGIVQIEAMSAGVPVVVSDLPGVRTVVWDTGFGEVTRTGDAADLTRGLVDALGGEYDARRARIVLEEKYLPPVPQDAYRSIYTRLGQG